MTCVMTYEIWYDMGTQTTPTREMTQAVSNFNLQQTKGVKKGTFFGYRVM